MRKLRLLLCRELTAYGNTIFQLVVYVNDFLIKKFFWGLFWLLVYVMNGYLQNEDSAMIKKIVDETMTNVTAYTNIKIDFRNFRFRIFIFKSGKINYYQINLKRIVFFLLIQNAYLIETITSFLLMRILLFFRMGMLNFFRMS